MKKVLFFFAMLPAFPPRKACGRQNKGAASVTTEDAAQKVYVAPGKYDEFYNFVSGGFNGQVSVYGLPSGTIC